MADDPNNTNPPNNPVPPPDDLPPIEAADTGTGEYVDDDAPQELTMERSSTVGTGPAKAMAFGFIMLVAGGFAIYSIFFSGGQPKPVETAIPTTPVLPPDIGIATPPPPPPSSPTPGTPGDIATISPPPLPPPPPPPTPPPPPPPKIAPVTPTVPTPPPPPELTTPPPAVDITAPTTIPTFANNDKGLQQRLRSNMLVMDSGVEAGTAEQKSANNALDASDPNRAFISNVLKATSADQQQAGRLSNLNMTIAQGKVINAVLETAVNTDLPGQLRAIVSRDIYPESGRNVLIPKGSRLIGVYNSVIRRGQTRVLIVWSRLIRPDGIDIMIGSPAIDSLGRAGVNGIVDNKYSEIFSAALLTSVITIGIATSVEAISGDETTTTTNSNGTTTTGGAGAIAAAGAVGNIGNIGKDIVNTMLDLKPTVTIDQGTRVDVFVNRDLIFPNSATNTQFIE